MDAQTLFTNMIFESESEVAQSCPTLCDPVGVAYQAPPSMGFSRQEYWSGLPLKLTLIADTSGNQNQT